MSKRVALVVDDNHHNRDFVERLLAHAGFEIRAADGGKAALDVIGDLHSLALAVVDMELADMNGLLVTSELRRRFAKACLVIATMHDDRSLMDSAFQKGCNVFLVKPHGFMELFKRITTDGLDAIRDGAQIVIDQYGPRSFNASQV